MNRKLCLVIIIYVKCALNVDVQAATQQPFVIFQPGEFFDPFKDEPHKDPQTSATVVTQPNILFGDTNKMFNQHFWHLPTPSANGYPRTIAQISGNAAQVNAQIRAPNKMEPSSIFYSQPLVWNTQSRYGGIQPKLTKLSSASSNLSGGQLRHSENENSQSSVSVERLKRPSASTAESVAQSSNIEAQPSHNAGTKSSSGGHSHKSDHHDSHVDTEKKDYKSDHHKDTKDYKKYDDHHKKSHNTEKGGSHKANHDEASHYKKYHEAKKSHKAAKFGEKKGHKRGHKTKGYHNKFHRDEYHREHRFYDDYHKEGFHEKHGDSHSHYKKKKGGHKKGGSSKSGHDSKKHGKKNHSNKGNLQDEHKGFEREGGRKKYQKHHRDFHKKQGHAKGKKYGYSRKH